MRIALFFLLASIVGCGYRIKGEAASPRGEGGVRVAKIEHAGALDPRVARTLGSCLRRQLALDGLIADDARAPRLTTRLLGVEAADPLFVARRLASERLVLRFELRFCCGEGGGTRWRSGLLETAERLTLSADMASARALRSAALERLGCRAGELAARTFTTWLSRRRE